MRPRGLTVLAVGGALLAAAVAGACAYFQEEAPPYRPPAYFPEARGDQMALGGTLYRRDCSFCHGAEGQGTARGPDLVTGANGPALTDFVLRTGRMPIDDPDQPIRRRTSPYDQREIDAIVTYLHETLDQPGPIIPAVEPAEGDLAEGEALYQEHCAACHATTGIGGAMLQDDPGGGRQGVHIPDLGQSTPVEVASAVRTGPGAMPRFGPGVIDQHELDSLVRYTEYLRDPEDRGGWPIGRVGPVVEGAVGWLLGLGALLVFARWVGTKRGEQT
jgi:ubiquinol-cytochrome c reductase cytochrome c subunit